MGHKHTEIKQDLVDFYTYIDDLPRDTKVHINSLQWLIDGKSGSGRTGILALVFIMKALDNPNKKVYVWDHDHSHSGQEVVRRLVQKELEKYPLICKRFKFATDYIMFIPEIGK